MTRLRDLPPDPKHPGKHLDPATGIWPIAEWGWECQRGLPEETAKRRKRSREWRKLRRPE